MEEELTIVEALADLVFSVGILYSITWIGTEFFDWKRRRHLVKTRGMRWEDTK